MMEPATLDEQQIAKLSGGYTQPRRQLEELRARGFWRARLGRDMKVVLETAHYEAVCAGALPPAAPSAQNNRPTIRPLAKTA